jgi:alpha-glucosidase (family GH31 glycosyl hydrolase)
MIRKLLRLAMSICGIRSLLVAPVVEKGATTRQVYLPRGTWYDFWTGQRFEGGREISRPVDLGTIPLYARPGSIMLMGPVKQFTSQKLMDHFPFQSTLGQMHPSCFTKTTAHLSTIASVNGWEFR